MGLSPTPGGPLPPTGLFLVMAQRKKKIYYLPGSSIDAHAIPKHPKKKLKMWCNFLSPNHTAGIWHLQID